VSKEVEIEEESPLAPEEIVIETLLVLDRAVAEETVPHRESLEKGSC
jgi:hypothetical protein